MAARLAPLVEQQLNEERIDAAPLPLLEQLYLPLAAVLARWCRSQSGTPVIGINGAQGTGKSTLCRLLQIVLEHGFGLRSALLAIDDCYRTRAERASLARSIHPLLATRGVPGTHDVDLLHQLLDRLTDPADHRPLALPAFDKAVDDRRPVAEWPVVTLPVDLVLFEGWCVGAVPQAEADLAEPVNRLEREEDPAGVWRRHVNRQLQKEYAPLFARLDLLIMLAAPDLESVLAWRSLQEQKLAARQPDGRSGQRIMDPPAIRRFIMHYQRLTEQMLAEMPGRADLVLSLDRDHRIAGIRTDSPRLRAMP